MPYRVPFIRPVFPASTVIGSDFDEIVASNWYTNFGPKERQFAGELAAYLGNDLHVVPFSNATIALMAILTEALGAGTGAHVLVPTFTFAAGPAAIEWAGFRPLLIDVDSLSLQPSLEDARRALEDPKVSIAGILLCNTFGIGNPDVDRWTALATEFSTPLIVDSAAGFGSVYGPDRPVGVAGLAEVFSFHATKPFAIGEGGAVVTRDPDLAARLLSFQNFGFSAGLGAVSLGLNGKLQEINAAIGLRQLATFAGVLESRQLVQRSYQDRLGAAGLHFPLNIECSSVCFSSVIFPTVAWRDAARSALTAADVEVRAYYSPTVHAQPRFANAARGSELAKAEAIAKTILSLPVHNDMSSETIEMITDTILGARS